MNFWIYWQIDLESISNVMAITILASYCDILWQEKLVSASDSPIIKILVANSNIFWKTGLKVC